MLLSSRPVSWASSSLSLARFPDTHTQGDAKKLAEKIKKKGGKELKPISENLVDLVWGSDRPARPNNPVATHPIQFAGKSIAEKLKDLRGELEKKKCSGFIVCE